MKIPVYTKQAFTDPQTGDLTPSKQLFFDVLIQEMQYSISDDGFIIPALKTSEINEISNDSTKNSKPDGTIWYDSETNQFKGKIAGVVKIFQMI